jgi:signal transduction histidine kinase/ActR/RegA family two-component response regulator
MDKQQVKTNEIMQSILGGLDALIYVTNPDTGEILFINEHMKQHYGIDGDAVGQLCYKLLQDGMDERCGFCPCHQLKNGTDKVIVWEEHSTLTKRTYRNTDRFIDWIDGSKAHLQHSIDITDIMQTRETLVRHGTLLKAVNQAAELLLALGDEDDIESSLIAGMELVGRAIEADRVHIWRNEEVDGKLQFTHTYSWLSEVGRKKKAVPAGIMTPFSGDSEWRSKFERNEIISGPVSRLSRAEKEYFTSFDVVSVVLIPLFLKDSLWGLVSIDDCEYMCNYAEEDITILRSVSLMMASAINRYSLTSKMNEANKRLALMLDTSPLCAQIWDRRLYTIDCNEAGVKLYGFKDKQEYVDRFLDCCSPEYQPDGQRSDSKAVALVNKAFDYGYCKFDWMHKMPYDDTPIPAEVTLVRAKYADEDVVIGYTRDMREHYKMMEEHEELMERRFEAETASKTKSAFLANMSHEIRTPMNAILGVTEILIQQKRLPSDIEEGLVKIYNSGNLLLGIINDILDFSKIEAGKLDIHPAKYELASLINDAVNLNVMKIEGKPITFELEIDETLPAKLIGDELRIKQILNNLLSNAFKYTESGKVTLSVSRDLTSDFLVLGVRDTGCGMTEAQLRKLYDEYSRFTNEGKGRAIEGTGLGLAITQSLVKLMGGEIHVESEFGSGSLFTVCLPQGVAGIELLGAEAADKLRNFRVDCVARKSKNIIRDPMPYGSVLIVDDIEPNLYVAEGLMRPYGLHVETVMSGRGAIEKVKNGKVYDVIFMDFMMPEMDGIETTKLLRELGYSEPIVVLTANAVAGQAEMFLRSGFDDYISKPIDVRQLDVILNRLVRDKQPPEVIEVARSQIYGCTPGMADTADDSNLALAALRYIDGLNADDAVSAMGGLYYVYEKSVKLTARLLPDTIKRMDKELSEGTVKGFTTEVHGLKSVLRNIGALPLGSKAERLEKAAIDGDMGFCNENYPPFKESLEVFHKKLSDAVFSETAVQKGKIDKDTLLKTLDEVKSAAGGYDAIRAIDALSPLLDLSYSDEVDILLEKVIFALEEFNCQGAVTNINKMEELLS